jgi:hypothetical protein
MNIGLCAGDQTAMIKLALSVVAVAAVATLGDFAWYEFGVRHRVLAGVLHGAALLMAAGGALGWLGGRTGVGLVVGVAAGVLGALKYYALASVMREAALLGAWTVVWLLLAIGHGRLIERPARPWAGILVRGALAAIISGVTFYLISDVIWGRAPAGGRNYAVHFACWCFAWAPGLIAIGAPARVSR